MKPAPTEEVTSPGAPSASPLAESGVNAPEDTKPMVSTVHIQIPTTDLTGAAADEFTAAFVRSTLCDVPHAARVEFHQNVSMSPEDAAKRRLARYDRGQGSKHPGLVAPTEGEWTSFFDVSVSWRTVGASYDARA